MEFDQERNSICPYPFLEPLGFQEVNLRMFDVHLDEAWPPELRFSLQERHARLDVLPRNSTRFVSRVCVGRWSILEGPHRERAPNRIDGETISFRALLQ